ncbi:MAG: phage head-tail connector protein [Clostridiales bacterium]|nr:phage head-tail connector protein [Clostridiales bacterium]
MMYDTLITLKELLGIEGNEHDGLLSFLLEDCTNMILTYCNIDTLPIQLKSLVPVMAADMYRAKGYGQESAPSDVKSISEGQRSVSYESKTPGNDFLENYYQRLLPFVRKRGRVPSDVISL